MFYESFLYVLHSIETSSAAKAPNSRSVFEVTPNQCAVQNLKGFSFCKTGRTSHNEAECFRNLVYKSTYMLSGDASLYVRGRSAVVHGSPVIQAVQSQPLGARALHDRLARILDEDNGTELHLTDELLEDIKVRACFAPERERALRWAAAGVPGAVREVRGARGARGAGVRVSRRARALSAEPLFERDNELASLPDMVLQCILQCPIDTRRALAENILVTGGGAALPGLKARLAQELRHLATQPPYKQRLPEVQFKFHGAPAHDNSAAWVGAALCGGACAADAARGTARDAYARARRLRDWPCLLHNTPPHHPHWSAQ